MNIDYNLLYRLVSYLVIGNMMAWYQLQGQFLTNPYFKQLFSKDVAVVVLGLPIGWLFWRSATLSYELFGAVWNIRLVGFGIGTLVFGIMTMLILKELPSWHTVISIILAVAIIMLQLANIK
jgi:hypothetical protein